MLELFNSYPKIKDYNDYSISREGKIYSFKSEKFLKTYPDKNGYHYVNVRNDLSSARKYVHRLVADAFLLKLNNRIYVKHKDGDKSNNHVDNLYITYSKTYFK